MKELVDRLADTQARDRLSILMRALEEFFSSTPYTTNHLNAFIHLRNEWRKMLPPEAIEDYDALTVIVREEGRVKARYVFTTDTSEEMFTIYGDGVTSSD